MRCLRAAGTFDDLPADIIASQMTEAAKARDLLGNEEEMVNVAADALDKHPATVARARGADAQSAMACHS